MAAKLILAAGGIVEKHTAEGLKIAVVYRTRHGPEWGLPKGKLEKKHFQEDEPFLAAALDEVRQETGCPVNVTGFAGPTTYYVGASPKVVLYWKMAPAGECAPEPRDTIEIKKVEWLTPDEAVEQLTHEEDKNLIARVFFRRAPGIRTGLLRRIKGALVRLLSSRRYRRLASAIAAYRTELGQRVSRCEHAESSCDWAEAAYEALCSAEAALRDGDIDKGWPCFHAAQRIELLALKPDEELTARVIALKEEAEKLSSWRKRATYELLSGLTKGPADQERVYVAALLRDEHYCNQAYKDGLLRSHMALLGLILAVLVSTVLTLVWLELLPTPGVLKKAPPDYKESFWMFVSVALFGLLGGTLSAMLKAPRSTKSSRIRELTATIRITLLRLCMSAAAAIIIYVFLKSDLSDPFLDSLEGVKPHTIFAISFVAGFTERLVMRAVQHVAGE